MTGGKRRDRISSILQETEGPVAASALASELGVSRQTIVGDIALMRSAGAQIVSTHTGYVFRKSQGHVRLVKVFHTPDQIEDELTCIVDLGGTVVDVVVNHHVYGGLTATLGVACRRDVARFMADIRAGKSQPLSLVTSGYHYHHISADSEDALDDIESALRERGYLVERAQETGDAAPDSQGNRGAK